MIIFVICSKCNDEIDEGIFVGLLFLDNEGDWVDNYYHINCHAEELQQNHDELVFASSMDCYNTTHEKYDPNHMTKMLNTYKTIYSIKNISTYVRVNIKTGVTSIFTPKPYCFEDDPEFEKIVFFKNTPDISVTRHNPDGTIDSLKMD